MLSHYDTTIRNPALNPTRSQELVVAQSGPCVCVSVRVASRVLIHDFFLLGDSSETPDLVAEVGESFPLVARSTKGFEERRRRGEDDELEEASFLWHKKKSSFCTLPRFSLSSSRSFIVTISL